MGDTWDRFREFFGLGDECDGGAVVVTNPQRRADLGVVNLMAYEAVPKARRKLDPTMRHARQDKKHRYTPKGRLVNTFYAFGFMKPVLAEEYKVRWSAERFLQLIRATVEEHKLAPPTDLDGDVAWDLQSLDEINELILEWVPELRELEDEQPLLVIIALETSGATEGRAPRLRRTSPRPSQPKSTGRDTGRKLGVWLNGVHVDDVPLHDDNVVGRGSTCRIRLDDRSISREHARIQVNGTITVTDLGSRNKTLLGADTLQPNKPRAWKPGEAARLGRYELRLLDDGDDEDTCDADGDTEEYLDDTEDAG